jgi:hypothetical protein
VPPTRWSLIHATDHCCYETFLASLRRHLLVLLFFTVLALLMTWPLITRINSVYAGNNEDLWTFQWDNWWTRYALQHGDDLLFTPVQFYPIGVSLAAHSLSFTNSLLWIPLAALFGDSAAYNLTVLLTFILSGYTMFLLAEYLLGSGLGSGSAHQSPDNPIPNLRSRSLPNRRYHLCLCALSLLTIAGTRQSGQRAVVSIAGVVHLEGHA